MTKKNRIEMFWITALLFASLLTVISSAREYCSIGPYYCEGFDSFDDAISGSLYKDASLASSYSCSHRENHYYCKSCCVKEGKSFVVFDVNDCIGGNFTFQSDCSLHNGEFLIEGNITDGNLPVKDIEVSVLSKSALTDSMGKFKVYLDEKSVGDKLSIGLKDYRKKYKDKILEQNVKGKTLAMKITLEPEEVKEIHRDELRETFVEGYIKQRNFPISFYNVELSVGDEKIGSKLAHLNGYFRFKVSDDVFQSKDKVSGVLKINGLSKSQAENIEIEKGRSNFVSYVIA